MVPDPAIAQPAPAAQKSPPRGWLLVFAAVALLGPLGLAVGVMIRAKEPLPVLGTVPAFSLVAQDGEAFGTRQLAGKVWVANFIFTRCTSICPPFTTKMAGIARKSAAQVPGLQLLSFSMDPEYDTPEVLAAYAQERQIDTTRWTFLTGPRDQMEAAVIRGLFQPWDKGNGSLVSIGHSSRFVLVDGRGQIRGFYPSTEEGAVERVVNDARILAAENTP